MIAHRCPVGLARLQQNLTPALGVRTIRLGRTLQRRSSSRASLRSRGWLALRLKEAGRHLCRRDGASGQYPAPISIVIISIPVPSSNEISDLLDHLLLDAGVAVLGEGAAWIGRDRVSVSEGAAVLAA